MSLGHRGCLKGQKRKTERGDRLKANHFSSWSRPVKVISDVLVSRNWYKTALNYTKIHRFLWDIFVFRVKAYFLNMICSNLPFQYKIVYMYIYEFSKIFVTILYQFLKTGTSDITIMGRDQEVKRLAFSLYPLHFPFIVPLNFSLSLYHHLSLSNITLFFLSGKY